MQRYDDRNYSRRLNEDDDSSWTGQYGEENRGRWGRGERFGEGRHESFGQSGAGRFDPQERERGWYGGQYGRGHGQSGGGYDRERFMDRDEPRYLGGTGRGDFGRSGEYQGYERSGGQYGRGGQWRSGGYDSEEGGRADWQSSDRQAGIGGQGAYRQGGLSQQSYGQPFMRYTEIWMIQGPHTGRGPRSYRRSDERIREDVCERLTQHGQVDASDLEIEVRDGDVTLRGLVDSRQTRRMAEEAVEDIPGVRDVTNQIRVRQGTGTEHRGGYGSAATGVDSSGPGSSNRLQLRPGMDVAGSDNKAIGKVKAIRDNDFLLERSMQRDVYVPLSALMRVTEDRATLNVVGDRIDDLHWDTPSAPGEPGWSLPTGSSTQPTAGQPASFETSGQRRPVTVGAGGRIADPGTRYGQEMANDPRFRGRRWEEAETELRTGYADWARRQGVTSDNDDTAWERLHQEVRRAFDESRR